MQGTRKLVVKCQGSASGDPFNITISNLDASKDLDDSATKTAYENIGQAFEGLTNSHGIIEYTVTDTFKVASWT